MQQIYLSGYSTTISESIQPQKYDAKRLAIDNQKYKKTDFLKRLTKMQHFDKVKVVRLTEIIEIWTSFSQSQTHFDEKFRH